MRGTAVAMMVRSRATRKRAMKLHSSVSQKRTFRGSKSSSSAEDPGGGCEGESFSASLDSTWPPPDLAAWSDWRLPMDVWDLDSAAMAAGTGTAGSVGGARWSAGDDAVDGQLALQRRDSRSESAADYMYRLRCLFWREAEKLDEARSACIGANAMCKRREKTGGQAAARIYVAVPAQLG
jgi:hypothetical protein